LSSKKNTSDIFKKIQSVFEAIQKNTGWEPKRHPKDIRFEIGEAPEYYEVFGVKRTKKIIIFGDWIDKVKPKAVSEHFWEFLIIRESFALFFSDDLLFGVISQLVSIFLNLLGLSYLQMSNPQSARDIKFYPIRGRFLLSEEESINDKDSISKIHSLIEIINQGTSYVMLYNTFMSFIEELEPEEIDPEEVLDDLSRYLSKDPEVIAAPIYIKRKTYEVLLNLIKFGFDTSANTIANAMNANQSTITRQIAKISSKFYAVWRLEKNYHKLGLFSYIIIIRYRKDNKLAQDEVCNELINSKYIEQFYVGENNQYYFQYTVINCPHVVAEKIGRKLSKYEQQGLLHSHDLLIIKERIFRTNIITAPFKATRKNFEGLLSGKISSNKIILWDSNYHSNKEKEIIDKKDINVLKFISIIISKNLTQFGLFGVHFNELQTFLEENGYNLNEQSECQTFINKLQNRAYEMGLFDYRFNISLTGVASSNMCIFIIKKDTGEFDFKKLIDEISIFGWNLIIDTNEKMYFMILGPPYDNPLTNLVASVMQKYELNFEYFSVKLKAFKYIDYSSLYDFTSQKWSL